jgi:hypothetical protein
MTSAQSFPLPFPQFVSKRLVFLPEPLRFLNKGFGGAFVGLFWVCVDPAVANASPQIRNYLLLHEWGHIRQRHNLVGLFSMMLAVFGVLPPLLPILQTQQWHIVGNFIGLVALAIEIIVLNWALAEEREFEADAFAASVLGPTETIAALAAMVALSGKGWTPLRQHRRTALYRLLAKPSTLQ